MMKQKDTSLKNKTDYCLFRFSPAWWPLRGAYTRSHLELGRQIPQRQWYYVLRPGRVGRCQACKNRTLMTDTERKTARKRRIRVEKTTFNLNQF